MLSITYVPSKLPELSLNIPDDGNPREAILKAKDDGYKLGDAIIIQASGHWLEQIHQLFWVSGIGSPAGMQAVTSKVTVTYMEPFVTHIIMNASLLQPKQ